MSDINFKSLGTLWSIRTEEYSMDHDIVKQIEGWLVDFEQRFSRFVETSEVNQFETAKPGEYEVSDTFLTIIKRAEEIRNLTNGAFDPAVSVLLEKAGYDSSYTLEPSNDIEETTVPVWSIAESKIHIESPVKFDFGGIGKGYAIDQVSNILTEHGCKHFIVDAGGDMFGTSKVDGSLWRIAIEYPGDADRAVGVAELNNQAIAVSDVFKRKWKNWHHIVDANSKSSVENVIGACAVANTAFDADSMTSSLFLGSPENYNKAGDLFNSEYICIKKDKSLLVSKDWSGEILC